MAINYRRIKEKLKLIESAKERVVNLYAHHENELECMKMTNLHYKLYCALREASDLLKEVLAQTKDES